MSVLGALALLLAMLGVYGVSPTDTLTFIGVTVLLAGYLPARRVAAVDPALTLRSA